MRHDEKDPKRATSDQAERDHTLAQQTERDRMLAKTDLYGPLHGDAMSVGATYNQNTKHWLVWLSTTGLDINIICAYEDQAKADAVVNAIIAAARSGDLADETKGPALLEQLRSSGIPELLLPDDLVATIVRDIQHHVVPLNLPAT
jgi:hypothetical protein